MKAITLHQPWASLLACGAKQFETRKWKTNYRGLIAIHAGKKELNSLNQAFNDDFWEMVGQSLSNQELVGLPYGAVIATAELVGCWQMNSDKSFKRPMACDCTRTETYFPLNNEILFGDWQPGRYAWEFKNVRLLPAPIPAKGKQRIWEWEGV